jgi:hypothetical protein
MKLHRYLLVYGLLGLLLFDGARNIYLYEYYDRRAPRVPDPSTGATYGVKASSGFIVYVTRKEWLWFGSYDFRLCEFCGFTTAMVALYLLNKRWNVIKTRGRQ